MQEFIQGIIYYYNVLRFSFSYFQTEDTDFHNSVLLFHKTEVEFNKIFLTLREITI